MRPVLFYERTAKWNDDLKLLRKAWPGFLLQFLRRQAVMFLTKVKLRTPVDSGMLQASWRLVGITVSGKLLTATFENTANDGYANYASYVEYGHSKPYKAGVGRPFYEAGTPLGASGGSDWVKGAFMLTFTEKEFMQSMPADLAAQIASLFRRYGVG